MDDMCKIQESIRMYSYKNSTKRVYLKLKSVLGHYNTCDKETFQKRLLKMVANAKEDYLNAKEQE